MAVAADRLRQGDHVGLDPGLLEAEEPAGAAAAHLDVVDDQQDLVLLAQIREAPQPLGAGGVDAALALHRLDDHGGGLVQPGAAVGEQALEVHEVGDDLAEVVVEGHRGRVHQRDAGAAALHRVAGDGQGAEGHAVEAVGEAHDGLAAGDLAGQLQRGLDGIGPAGAGEGDLVVQAAGPEDLLLEGLEELAAHVGEHVQAVHDPVLEVVVDDDLLQLGVVVAVVQGAGAGEEVDVLAAVLGGQHRALGVREHGGPAAGVGADAGLELGRVGDRGAGLVGRLGLRGGLVRGGRGHAISSGGVVRWSAEGRRARGGAPARRWGTGGELSSRRAGG